MDNNAKHILIDISTLVGPNLIRFFCPRHHICFLELEHCNLANTFPPHIARPCLHTSDKLDKMVTRNEDKAYNVLSLIANFELESIYESVDQGHLHGGSRVKDKQ